MKRLLLAGGAIATLSAAAFAMDGDDKQHTRVRVNTDQPRLVVGGEGPIVELRGANGERTLHVERDGEDTVIRVNGQLVEIHDGTVTVDGQPVEAGRSSVVVIDGDDVRVIDGDYEMEFDREFTAHLAERAEHLARLHTEMAGDFDIDIDVEGLRADVMTSLEATLADLEGSEFHDSDDWDELSPQEREEVREAMREAREEIREAMAEVRIEMREVERELEGERRRVRIEMRQVERDRARAARDIARAERDVARAAREQRVVEMIRRGGDPDTRVEFIERDPHAPPASWSHHREIRVEEEDGRTRVWVDGTEQTGDDLTGWLNQLQSDRLAGGPGDDRAHRRVERLEWRSADDEHRIIELDGGTRVVILEGGEDN